MDSWVNATSWRNTGELWGKWRIVVPTLPTKKLDKTRPNIITKELGDRRSSNVLTLLSFKRPKGWGVGGGGEGGWMQVKALFASLPYSLCSFPLCPGYLSSPTTSANALEDRGPCVVGSFCLLCHANTIILIPHSRHYEKKRCVTLRDNPSEGKCSTNSQSNHCDVNSL